MFGETCHGTLSFALVAWSAVADSFCDLDYRRPALENAEQQGQSAHGCSAHRLQASRQSARLRSSSQTTPDTVATHFQTRDMTVFEVAQLKLNAD